MEIDADILRDITRLGARFVGARYGAMGMLNDRGNAVQTFVPVGIDEQTRAAIGDPPRGRGILGAVIRDPRPIRIRDLLLDPRSAGFPPGHPLMRSFLGVPLFRGGKAYGNFYFAEKEGAPEFTEADARLAECFAQLAVDYLQDDRTGAETVRCLELLRSAMEDTDSATMIANPSLEIVYWSRGARRLFGFTEEEALGKQAVRLLVPPEDAPERRFGFRTDILRKLENGEVTRVQFRLLHKDGRRMRVPITLFPICHRVGGVVAVTCLSRFEPA